MPENRRLTPNSYRFRYNLGTAFHLPIYPVLMTPSSPIPSLPLNRPQRWDMLRDILSAWYRPLTDSDGVLESELDAAERQLGNRLPRALREWYVLAGRCDDLWSHSDVLLPPQKALQRNDVLVFMVENQGVVEWGVDSRNTDDDPPVVVSSLENQGAWIVVTETVSQFALQAAVYNLKGSKHCKWWANACVPHNAISAIESTYFPLPFTELHWPHRIRYFGCEDIFVVIEPQPGDGEYDWITAFTRTSEASRDFIRKIGPSVPEWNAWSDEWPSGWVST